MPTNDAPPQLALETLIHGYQLTKCIYVTAKLGIADLLKDGPRTSEELAQMTGTHAPSLYRVLRLLTAAELLSEGEGHAFTLTPLGTYLQTGVPGSLRTTAINDGGEPIWQVWGALLQSVETGQPAFQDVVGQSNWDYFAQHPEAAALYDQTMSERTASVAPTVASAYDFSSSGRLVDVGGGRGQMLAPILQAHPTLHAVLFDFPHVVQGAPLLLEAAGVADRCEIIGGDAFTAVPANADTYLLSRVLHLWDDERAIALLTRCHQGMQPHGKVLLVERVILSNSTPQLLVLESDVTMLVATGGKERTDAEYRALLGAAGFELRQLIPVLPPYSLIEAVRV